MKKKGLLVILLVFLFGLNNVMAEELISNIEAGNSTYQSQVENATSDDSITVDNKTIGGQNAYCISGKDVAPPTGVCVKTTTLVENAMFLYLGKASASGANITAESNELISIATTRASEIPTILLNNNTLEFEYVDGYYQSNTINITNINELVNSSFEISGVESEYLQKVSEAYREFVSQNAESIN